MSELTVAERVAAGVEVLDAWDPTWPSMINVDTLDVGSMSRCVTAQTAGRTEGERYGDYSVGMEELGIVDGASYGFAWSFGNRYEEVPALNAEWRRVIAERLA